MLGHLWCQCSSCAYQHTKTNKYPDQDVYRWSFTHTKTDKYPDQDEYRWSFTNANKYTGTNRHEDPNQDFHDWSVANGHANQDKDSYTVRDGCADLE
jgi:hypothetical protein